MEQRNAVLFVDDEIQVLNALKRGLMDQDYTCYFATSGKDALDILKKQTISVIVTDMRMPEMNGLQLLREVSVISPRTVKIVLTGYTQISQVLATINSVDIFRFVTKPWNLEEELIEIIQQAVDYYQLQEVNEQLMVDLQKRNEAYLQIFATLNTKIATVKRHGKIMGKLGHEMLVAANKSQSVDQSTETMPQTIQVSIFDALMKTTLQDEVKMEVTTLFEDVAEKLKGLKVINGAPFSGKKQEVLVNSDLIATYFRIGLLVMRDESKNKEFQLDMEVTESERMRFQLSAEIKKAYDPAKNHGGIMYYNQVIGASARAGELNSYAEMEGDRLVFTFIYPIKKA